MTQLFVDTTVISASTWGLSKEQLPFSLWH